MNIRVARSPEVCSATAPQNRPKWRSKIVKLACRPGKTRLFTGALHHGAALVVTCSRRAKSLRAKRLAQVGSHGGESWWRKRFGEPRRHRDAEEVKDEPTGTQYKMPDPRSRRACPPRVRCREPRVQPAYAGWGLQIEDCELCGDAMCNTAVAHRCAMRERYGDPWAVGRRRASDVHARQRCRASPKAMETCARACIAQRQGDTRSAECGVGRPAHNKERQGDLRTTTGATQSRCAARRRP